MFGNEGWRINSSEEGLGGVGGVGVEVIQVAADLPPPNDQREWDGAFIGWGMVPREKEVFLEVGGFGMDEGGEMIMF